MAATFYGRAVLELRAEIESTEAHLILAEELLERMWDCFQKRECAGKVVLLRTKLTKLMEKLEEAEKDAGYRMDDDV